MKRKLVSILLAAVMTVSSLNITEAASIDAEDFVSSEETVIEHEQDTETEQEIQTETEQQTETNVTSGNDTGFNGEDLTDTPSDITSDPPIETIPHTVTYKADKADLFFNDDLKKLKDGTLEEPFSLSDEAETETESAEEKEHKTACIETAREILPEEYASLLTEDSYDLLMEQKHEYTPSETVDFYVIPESGYEVDTVKALYAYGEEPVTDFEKSSRTFS